MSAARSLVALLAALLAAQLVLAAPPAPAPRARRQLADDNALQPLDDAAGDEQARDKRKFEGVTEAKFGIKNAVLGFVFGKINSLIDSKTRLVENLDRQNIEINKQYGIEAPKGGGGLSSLSGIVGQVIGPKLQFLAPKLQAVTGLLGGASGGGSADWRYVEAPHGVHGELRYGAGAAHGDHFGRIHADSGRGEARSTRWSPSPLSTRRGRSSPRASRQATPKPADDIPVFDRNKVSLDFPGNLFGPSVSLLIRTTKIVGDVIQNSAVRYQSFLRLFRPLFRGQFEIKGLDPPTTTSTTTTTTTTTETPSTAIPADNDNEVNRKR